MKLRTLTRVAVAIAAGIVTMAAGATKPSWEITTSIEPSLSTIPAAELAPWHLASIALSEPIEPEEAAATGCSSCGGVFQSLPSDGRTHDLSRWMRHSYPGSDWSHLAMARGKGPEGFSDFQISDGGGTIFFTKAADGTTGTVLSLEQFHLGKNWIYIDFEWLDGKANGGKTTYRKFTDTDVGSYVGEWAPRRARTGVPFSVQSPFRSCPDGQRYSFRGKNTLWGPVEAPYTKCIFNPQTHESKPVRALVLESIYGSPKHTMYREWYWYGKSVDRKETYGLIRWDFYQRTGEQGSWRLVAGGCQMNRIVLGEACLPWNVIKKINGSGGCAKLGASICR